MEAVLPTLVADMAAGERYHLPLPLALGLPLKVYVGADDEVDWRTTLGWHACTAPDHEAVVLPGGHRFLATRRAAVTARVSADLATVAA